MKQTSFRKMTAASAVGRIALALAAARESDTSVRIPARFTPADAALIRQAPAWVARAALLKSARAWWLWCEPRRGRARDGQCILDLPAGRAVELKPGGYHVMLMDLKQQMKEGEVVPVTLIVETAGKRETIEVKAAVRAPTARNDMMKKHGG